jgi:hypothetical protein
MNTSPNPPVAAPRRIAVYRLGDEPKSLVAKLTLMLEAEAADQIQIESESQEFISTVREILKRTGNDGSNDTSGLALPDQITQSCATTCFQWSPLVVKVSAAASVISRGLTW